MEYQPFVSGLLALVPRPPKVPHGTKRLKDINFEFNGLSKGAGLRDAQKKAIVVKSAISSLAHPEKDAWEDFRFLSKPYVVQCSTVTHND